VSAVKRAARLENHAGADSINSSTILDHEIGETYEIPGETPRAHLHDVGVVQAVPHGDLLLEGVQDGPLLLLAAALRDVQQLHRHLAPLVPPAMDAPKRTRSNLDKDITLWSENLSLWLLLRETLEA
jgi:hypothetical protein